MKSAVSALPHLRKKGFPNKIWAVPDSYKFSSVIPKPKVNGLLGWWTTIYCSILALKSMGQIMEHFSLDD